MKITKACIFEFTKKHLLMIATFASVVLGLIVGVIVRATTSGWTNREIMYLNYIGELFLRMLKSLILPLISTSLITGIASLNLGLSRKIGGRAVAFYLTTTFLSVLLGIGLVMSIRPGGVGGDVYLATNTEQKNTLPVDTMLDLIRNLFPPNIMQACLELYQTKLIEPENSVNASIYDYAIESVYVSTTNIMGIVVVSTSIGIALSMMQSDVIYLISIIEEFYRLTMKITSWIINLSPLGIFFLVLSQIIGMSDLAQLGGKLGAYFGTVLAGCIIQGLIILPIIYFVFTRRNPYRFIGGLSQALVTAFGTSSSSATLPVTLQCIIENNNVDENVAKFMLPIGSAINMDGTALYEAVAAIFIAQLRGVDLSFSQILAISVTATAASIGAAGIPSAGLVTMIMVLETVGLPAEDVSIILSVDWLLDRFRTVTNVLGDSFGAGIVNHCSKKYIDRFNDQKNSGDKIANSKADLAMKDISDENIIDDKHAVINPVRTFSKTNLAIKQINSLKNSNEQHAILNT